MKAFFKTSPQLIEQAVASESKKHEDFPINVYTDDMYTVAEGSTQQIMYLIGEIAGYGEASLTWIEAE